jgi:hypothetical protein
VITYVDRSMEYIEIVCHGTSCTCQRAIGPLRKSRIPREMLSERAGLWEWGGRPPATKQVSHGDRLGRRKRGPGDSS